MKKKNYLNKISIKTGIVTIVSLITLLMVFCTAFFGDEIRHSIKSVFNGTDLNSALFSSLTETSQQDPLSSQPESGDDIVSEAISSESSITKTSSTYYEEDFDENISSDPVPPKNVSEPCDTVAEGRIVDYTVPASNDDIAGQLSQLAQKYPNIISLDTIGSSVMGRSIKLVKLGTGKRKACVIGGIHAREHITVSYVMRCIEEFAIAYNSESGLFGEYNIKKMLDTYTLYIVPCSNPDGLAIVNSGESTLFDSYKPFFLSQMKANANGVDLNRNFPFMWDSIENDIPSPNTYYYKGSAAASEPETTALMSLCNNNDFHWMLSFHIQGNCIYWRDTENGEVPGDLQLANRLSDMCGLSINDISSDVNGFGGGFENWFRSAFNRPGMCIELAHSSEKIYPTDSYNNLHFNDTVVYEKTKYAIIAAMLQENIDDSSLEYSSVCTSSQQDSSIQVSSQQESSHQASSQPVSSLLVSSQQDSSLQISSQNKLRNQQSEYTLQ